MESLETPKLQQEYQDRFSHAGTDVATAAIDEPHVATVPTSAPIEEPIDRSRFAHRSSSAPTIEILRQELDILKRRERQHRATLRHMGDELRLAASLQRNLRSPVPHVEGVDIRTLHRAADVVSGDMVDVVRLDESRVALVLADATGHGVAAGLLSTFVRQSLRGKVVTDRGYHLLDPGDVMLRTNADILGTNLTECQFVTALYAIYDEQLHTIRWARAGSPYPILVRPGQPPRQLVSEGAALGVIAEARFEVVELRLEPGDTLIFHTDGLDAVLLEEHDELGCCDLEHTSWFKALGQEPIGSHLEQLEGSLGRASKRDSLPDDVTVLSLHLNNRISTNRNLQDLR